MSCTSPHDDRPISFHINNPSVKQKYAFHSAGNKGAGGALRPGPGGGLLALVVAANPDAPEGAERPTAIGLHKFKVDGTMDGGIRWVQKDPNAFLSYPQLVYLGHLSGTHRYLLGWAVMRELDNPDDQPSLSKSYDIPWEYYVMEIDDEGNALTEPERVDGSGWGEKDEMVSLGQGKVAWAYIEDSTLNTPYGAIAPPCNVNRLQLSVYTSDFQ